MFEIKHFLGFDNEEPKKYDLKFLGRANPGRPNAYKFSVAIDELYNETSNYLLVIALKTHIVGHKDIIAYYTLQFKDTKNSGHDLNVTLRNKLESKRAEALKILKETFKSYNREDYDQENWTEIYNVERRTRESINVEMELHTIDNLLEQALVDLKNVPVLETD